jgi:recombinational DNA repair ATPase RecF
MLKLTIANFKCFHEIDIPLNQLTVFAGANGNGKSTVIQALLFLRRTIEHCVKWDKDHFDMNEFAELNVELNGPYCLNLGNSGYVLPPQYKQGIKDNYAAKKAL